ncbi:response regulator [Polaribacter sargassicola]|uniref:response regulator n=1 Tax=Polaribacter sargassicola TaxID=2836891 RepID=UPI001F3A3EFC|nr:response regulator [Polaribacter sp. DS7-9]MCG1036498.1 response regulator [Polaribacter sp. DS7-9]
MKILVADDSELSRKLLNLSISDNHEVVFAVDGSDALEKIKKETPDLVILDIMMPFITGLELVAWIKDNYNDQIKIIILTSLGAEDVVLEAFSLGVDDFVTKPFDPKDLSLRIRRFEQ